MSNINIVSEVFSALRNAFFDSEGTPKRFNLREKLNTQDDPFDEYIALQLDETLESLVCQKASGPLISPDMVVLNPVLYSTSEGNNLSNNSNIAIAIEVKKLERSDNGVIARKTGLDYNSTPPCGTVRVYDAQSSTLDIKAYYLFACLENVSEREYFVSAFVLCDGSILNDDFDFYLSIVNQRQKEINLGSFKDGANRNRPMLIFSNPLGANIFDRNATLISSLDLSQDNGNIVLTHRLLRKDINGVDRIFYGYRMLRDLPVDYEVLEVKEPFPQPQKRVGGTQSRGKFKLEVKRS